MRLKNFSLLVVMSLTATFSLANNTNSPQEAKKLFTAYELADCNTETIFYEAYLSSLKETSQSNSIVESNHSSMMLKTCDECPGLSFASLQGIAGYPQVSELSLCGAADTVSMLMYNAGECPLGNLVITVNFDSGLAYGGFVEEQYGKSIVEFDVSDPANPQFLITAMDSAEVYIMNFGMTADCDVDFASIDPLNFDITYDYSYDNTVSGTTTCNGVEPEIGNFNNGIKVPVLNVLTIDPITRTLSASNTPGCQNIVIRQDGLGAKLSEFTVDVCGYSDAYSVAQFRTAPDYTPITYTTDPVTGNLTGTIDGSHISNIGNGDEIMDANEQVTVQVCYEAAGCLDDPMFLEYKATYGCNGKKCGDPSTIEGAVEYIPDFGANAVATASMVEYGGICGNNLSFDMSLTSANTDPLDGLWQDVSLKMNACLGGNMSLVAVNMNGAPIPAAAVIESGSTIEIDFSQLTADPDGAGVGLEDVDGDGIFNDLPGGNTIDFDVEIAIGCADDGSMNCNALACSISRVEVNGKRNCGQDFQQFANLSEPVNFFYGETSQANNEMMIMGYSTPITEVVTTTANVWNPFVEGYVFSYEFGSDNITPCPSGPGNLYAVATVNAGGNRINHLRYEEGSATYQGVAVPGVTWMYNTIVIDAMGTLDTTSITINIPAGDTANDPSHEYYFNLEAEGQCFSNDYMNVTFQIVEECDACGDPAPCKIIRSCNGANTYVDWNGLMCPCFIRGFVETQERTNYGYTDKTMTTKVDTSTIPAIDKQRYLPGDTMYVRQGFEILDAEQVIKGDGIWGFVLHTDSQVAAPVVPDFTQGTFKGWFVEKASTGVVTEIGVPTCLQDPIYDDVNNPYSPPYPSIRIWNLGVEGICDQNAAGHGTCLTNPRINPNYPAEGVFNYGLAPLSVNATNADRPAMYVYWGDDPECATATDLAKNDCYEAFLDEWDFQDGDIIYIDYEAPMMHNPDYDLQQLNGTAFSSQGSFYGSMYVNKHNPDCKQTRMATSCNASSQYHGHIPGPVSIATEVSVTDCDIQVSYDFNLSNLLPATGAGEEPWFANEIRNVVAVEYLEPQFPSNMVYLGDGTIRMPDGSVVPIPSANIDDTQGNLSCVVEGGVACCVAEDATELMGLRINDDDYNVLRELPYMSGPSGPYETGNPCDIYGYTHKPNDPFPMFAVGGGVDCAWGMDFSLTALCPEDIESSDFRLKYQFADKYLSDLSSKAPTSGCGGAGMNVSTNSYPATAAGTPYAGSHAFRFPVNPYAQGDCSTLVNSYTCHFWGTITTHPDASPGSLNPMRQTGELITTPDNFTDNSLDYPPLTAMLNDLLLADEGGTSEFNTYEVCAGSVAGGATHMNVVTSITLDNSVDFLGVTDAGGAPLAWTLSSSTATTTTYALVMPDIAPGECESIIIETELLFCPIGLDITTNVCVSTVSGCLPPDKAAVLSGIGEGCNGASSCYRYIAEEADLQAEWQPDALPEVPLCGTIELQTVVKNVKKANLVDIEPRWWYPTGLNFIPGSWEICYPCGPNNAGPCFPIVDPTPDPTQNSVHGTYFEYLDDQIWSSALPGDPINSAGLPGILSSLDSNFVKFKYDVETICDEFISGTSVMFEVDAADPCEQRVGPGLVPSPPIIVQGANPADFAQFFVFADPVEASCGTDSEIVLTYLNTSPIGVTDNSMVCMDIETTTFAYMPGSVYMVSPSTYTPTFTESTNGSITHICFDIPDGIGPGQVFQTGFSFMVPEDISCGSQDLGVKVSSELMSQNCMAQGIECSVGVLNSVNPVINIEFLPPVTVERQELRLGCSTTDGKVEACYDIELVNNGATYSNDINIALIYDLDQNGQIDDYDVKLDSVMTPVLIPAGDTLMLSGCLEIQADQACPVFLMVMQETNCVCDAQDYYYDSLQPDLGLDGQTTFGVCPGEPFGMELCGDFTYTLEPSTSGIITETADSLYVDLDNGASEVVLNVTGAVGQCAPFDYDVTIKSLMDFELGPFSTIEVCSNACKVLNAGIPIEYQPDITVEWVPATYLDDPTSMTPTACNVTSDITYTIIATFTSGDAMCVFNADLPIVVSDPVVEDLFTEAFLCETDVTPIEAPAGKDNYFWYEVNPAGDDVIAAVGASFSPEEPGTYYLVCSSSDDVCETTSNQFEVKPCVDLALVKTVNPSTPGPYSNGSTVTYDVTVYNQSTTVDVYNVYIKDYFPECLVLNDPTWSQNTAPTAGAPGEAVIVSPIALITANGQQTRTITFTISPTCSSTPIINNAEISGYDDDNDPTTPPAPDEDSVPDDNAGDPAETGTDNNYDDENPNMPGSADDPADSDDYDPEEIEFIECPTIGGEVFVDINNNGCQDAEDTEMVEGAEVTIWTCDPATGEPVAEVGTTTTDPDGQWSFGGAAADGSCILDATMQYTASFDVPNGAGEAYEDYTFSEGTAPAGCAAGEDDNVDPATGQAESCFDPADDDAGDGDDDENIDAGITPPCESLGGELFVDTNNNGCQDASETTMVEGAEVTIWECDPATGAPTTEVGTATTGPDGAWSFGGAGDTGACALDPDATYAVSFNIPNGAGEAYEGYEFSENMAPAGCAAGASDDVDPTTGESGCYDPEDDDAGDGNDDENIDAGITPPCQTIGGEVFVDDNNNGCQDASETTMVEGAEVTIWSCDPVTGDPDNAIGVVTTGPDGTWTFGGQNPATGECYLDPTATYTASFDLPNAAGDVAGDPYVGYDFSTGEADASCAAGESDDVDSDSGIAESCYDPNDDDAADGDADNNIDAGIAPCPGIGGEVFVDANNNGCQDAGETTMVEGVEVTIWICDPVTGAPSSPIGTATTGTDGAWSFDGADPTTGECLLDPNETYTASFDLPNAAGDVAGDPYVGYDFSTGEADASCAAGESDDVDSDTGIAESCYDPTDDDAGDGNDDNNIDAGISPCESMGGTVFIDANNNGCQDAGETTGVEGAEVTIWSCDPITGAPVSAVGSTMTAADGSWSFDGADPATGDCLLDPDMTYVASFDIPNGPGETYEGHMFSSDATAACANDADADDVDGMTGISQCYNPDDEDGADGDSDEDIDAGVFPCQMVGGTVFFDMNINGCQDNGETAVASPVGVSLFECGQNPATDTPIATTTTINGDYNFGPGSPNDGAQVCLESTTQYFVVFDIPNGPGEAYENYVFTEGNETCANPEDADDVDPATGESQCYDPTSDDGDDDDSIDAGIFGCESVAGVVFYDNNNNGCQEGSETNIDIPITVNLFECGQDPATATPVASTTTIDGVYEFGLDSPNDNAMVCLEPIKSYFVEFELPNADGEALDGYQWSSNDGTCNPTSLADDIDPATSQSECYNPEDGDGTDGDSDENIDAGIFPCQELAGDVFFDIDNNGCQETGENFVTDDVRVNLFECGQDPSVDAPLASTNTDAGQYEFGENVDDPDAQICLEPGTQYFVQFDINNGAGEPLQGYGISTNSNFCANAETTDDTEHTTGQSTCFDPAASDGDDDQHIDVGIFECEAVGGVVFYDMNNNGCQDAGETPVAEDVTVTLYECSGGVAGGGTPVASTTTIDGEYEFGAFSPNPGGMYCLEPAKEYYVVFDIPNAAGESLENWNLSSHADACANPDAADDVDPATGQSGCYDPEDAGDDDDNDGDNADGSDDNHIDAGIYPCEEVAGEVFYDLNNNGCQDAGDTPVTDPVNVTLYECAGGVATQGTPVASTTTIGGAYEFGPESTNPGADVCLDPYNTYFVVFDVPQAAGDPLEDFHASTGEEVCAASADSDDVNPSTLESGCYSPSDPAAGDDGDEDIDMGLAPCQTLGGEIFLDENADGCQDAGEGLVMEDVTVTLFECNAGAPGGGTALASTTVNDGQYEFGPNSTDAGADVCLEIGTEYYVEFSFDNSVGTPLEGFDFSVAEGACATTTDADDIDPSNGQSGCFDPFDTDGGDGDDDNHIDAGVNPCEEIQGQVYVDSNNNGCQDAGETLSMDPVNVSVFECGQDPQIDVPVASTQTVNGEYEFGPNSTNPGGMVCLDPAKEYFILFEIPKAPGSPLEFYEFSSNEGTCANGSDSDDIDPSFGLSECFDPENTDPNDGDDDEHVDAGIYPCQTLGGEIFLDEDNSGCQDNGEGLVTEEVSITLFECNAGVPGGGVEVASTTTNDGTYSFGPESTNANADICLDPAKQYYVVFDFDDSAGAPLQGHKFSSTEGACANGADGDDVDPSNGQSGCYDPNADDDDNDIDAGINPCQSLGGTAFMDLNGNGCQDNGEGPAMEDITVSLYECDTNGDLVGAPLATTTTINGQYEFGEDSPNQDAQICLEAGKTYAVDFDFDDSESSPLHDHVFTVGSDACADTADGDDVDHNTGVSGCYDPDDANDDSNNHIDAGIMPLAKLGNMVWEDCDGDGTRNGEQGIGGIKVELYDLSGNLLSTAYTNANGNYIFDGLLPGQYYVKFYNGDYEFTNSNQGGNSLIDSDVTESNGSGTTDLVTLSPGECNFDDFDAGLYKCIQIGERVWLDYNENDVWDETENGINGLKVELYKYMNNSWVYYDYEYTGHKPGTPSDDGYFKFCVPPGDYYLRFLNPPASLVPAVQNFGINDNIDSDVTGFYGAGTTDMITVRCGQDRCDIGAGYYKMGSIGDHVWQDNNNNGMREANEPGLANVVVRAIDLTGTEIASTTTDANGNYMMDYLGKNTYYLQFDIPANMTVTYANMGTDEAMDSDVDGSNGPMTTPFYNVLPGTHTPHVDAGVVYSVLGIEWQNVWAENEGAFNSVNWVVSSESNVSHYEVERSLDGLTNFEVIGSKLSLGNSTGEVSYSFGDYDVDRNGIFYYRIKEIDLDGDTDYSKVVSVERDLVDSDKKNRVDIYPNPVVEELTIELNVLKEIDELNIKLYDTQGRIVRSNLIMDVDLQLGQKNYKVDVSDLAKGIYTIKINMDRTQVIKKLIVIEQ